MMFMVRGSELLRMQLAERALQMYDDLTVSLDISVRPRMHMHSFSKSLLWLWRNASYVAPRNKSACQS